MLHLIGKQAYKLELPKKWKIHDVFYVSLLEQDTTRKGRVHEENTEELDAGDDSGEYKVEAIWNSTVYAKESELGHLLGLYFLVSWKGYLKEKNTWEPALVVQHLRKLISSFHKDHLDKPTATSLAINTAPPMARLTVKLPVKQKRGQPIERAKKRAKWDDKEEATKKRQQRGIQILTKSFIIQVSYHPSPSSTKPRPFSLHQSRFFLPCPSSRLEGFFINDIYTLIFRFSFPVPLIAWEVFYWLIPCPVFPLSLPIIGLGGFLPATWPFETHQLPHGARIFSFITWFSSSVSYNWVGRFFTRFPFFNRQLLSTLNGVCVQEERQ